MHAGIPGGGGGGGWGFKKGVELGGGFVVDVKVE